MSKKNDKNQEEKAEENVSAPETPEASSNERKIDYGLKAVLDKALETYEKLPMLETVFDRLVRLLTTSFRNFTSETVNINIKEYSSERFGTFFQNIKQNTPIVVYKVIEWENLGLIVINRELLFVFVDLLLGGKKNENKSDVPERAFTYIEQSIVKQVAEVVLNELSSSFDPVSPATCLMERLETNPNFASITRHGDPIIRVTLQIDLDGRGGNIDVIIPYATIEPIKELLQQIFIGEKFGSDAEWEDTMRNQSMNIKLPVEAVIINKPTTISKIFNLKVGDTIITDNKENDPVLVRCENVNIFSGKIGKIEDKVAVDLLDIVIDEKKL